MELFLEATEGIPEELFVKKLGNISEGSVEEVSVGTTNKGLEEFCRIPEDIPANTRQICTSRELSEEFSNELLKELMQEFPMGL